MAKRRMTSKGNIVIEGLDELLEQFDSLTTENIYDDVAAAGAKAVDMVGEAIRSEAPRGPTGNLKGGIVTKMYKKRKGEGVGGFVSPNYSARGRFIGGYTLAPHAHLVEFGTSRGAAPNPFFTRGYARSKNQAESVLVEGIKAAIDKAIS